MLGQHPIHTIERYLGAQLEQEVKPHKAHATDQSSVVPAPSPTAATEVAAPKEKAKCSGTCAKCRKLTIKKILVALDHEQHPALEMALTLAGPFQAQVAVVHVLEPLNGFAAESAGYGEALLVQRGTAERCVKAIEQEIPEKAKAFTCLREGPAANEILSAAEEWQADLIVMGTHRRGGVARLFVGSTSQAVLRKAPCPVLLVADVAGRAEPLTV